TSRAASQFPSELGTTRTTHMSTISLSKKPPRFHRSRHISQPNSIRVGDNGRVQISGADWYASLRLDRQQLIELAHQCSVEASKWRDEELKQELLERIAHEVRTAVEHANAPTVAVATDTDSHRAPTTH